jgi:hypothetical protein
MRFALLGDHSDGLETARALTSSGRNELVIYSGPALGMEYLHRWGLQPRRVGDVEETLADPRVDAVIVAGRPVQRPGQLRRSLQAERHVLCVCPVDDSPDVAYEAAMIQEDTGKVLFPILPEATHPGFHRLAELARSAFLPRSDPVPAARADAVTDLHRQTRAVAGPEAPLSSFRLLPMTARLVEVERWSSEEILLEAEEEGHRPGFPGWDILRLIGGEIGEICALSPAEEVDTGDPLLLTGKFAAGGMFQATYLPMQAEARLRVALVYRASRAELIFPQGWPGPAQLIVTDDQGQGPVESWDGFNPWAALGSAFEEAVRNNRAREPSETETALGLAWQDAVRGLELDDAARRSVQRRRASTLEYQEITEEAGFKGTMTLVGCSILWISLMLLVLSAWVPWLGWVIAPAFGIFLVLQLLRWAVPDRKKSEE